MNNFEKELADIVEVMNKDLEHQYLINRQLQEMIMTLHANIKTVSEKLGIQITDLEDGLLTPNRN